MVSIIYSTIGGTGSTYETVQAWETATRKDLVAADEAHIGIIFNTGQWVYPNEFLIIGNSGASATDSLRNRQLLVDPEYIYDQSTDLGVVLGSSSGSVSGGENYFTLGPGIGIQYGGDGYAVDLSGKAITVVGCTLNLSGNNNGIRFTDHENTGVILNSLVYGSFSGNGIVGDEGIYSLNNTLFNRFPGTGVQGCNSVNTASLSDNGSYVPFYSGSQYYCAITSTSGYALDSETNLTGILQIHQFKSTITGIEDFSIRSTSYSDIYSAGVIIDQNAVSDYGGDDLVYSSLTGQFVFSKLDLLASDITGFLRPDSNLERGWSIGAFERDPLLEPLTGQVNAEKFTWYLASGNSSDLTEHHGLKIGTEKLYEGPIDFLPEIINPRNTWKQLTGWSTNLPRIGVTGSSGNYSTASFYRKDTLEEFKIRGWNLFQTAGDDSLTGFYYSDFSDFNSGNMATTLDIISNDNFNCVRVFIDRGSPTGRNNSVTLGLTGTALSSGYLDNFSTFVNMCADRSLYVLPVLWDIPYSTYYQSTLWNPSYDASVVESGNSRMDPGYLNTKKAYVTGFVSEVLDRVGSGRMSTILAWTVDNNFQWRTDQAPYLTGYVTAATGISGLNADNPGNSSGVWYMDSVADRNLMSQLNIRSFYSGLHEGITGIDSEALMTASFSKSITGYLDLTPLVVYESEDFKYHTPFLYDLSGSSLDFIGLNLYPEEIYTGSSPSRILNRLGISGADRNNQPLVLSEFGINSGVFSQVTGNALTYCEQETVDLDGYQFKGYLAYSYYGTQPTGLGDNYHSYSGLSERFSPDFSPNIPLVSGNHLSIYRKLFVRSDNQDNLYNPRIYIEDPKYISQVSIAKESYSGDFSYSSYSIPEGISVTDFSNPFNYSGALRYDTLGSGNSLSVWTRIHLNGPITDPQSSFRIILAGTSRE